MVRVRWGRSRESDGVRRGSSKMGGRRSEVESGAGQMGAAP